VAKSHKLLITGALGVCTAVGWLWWSQRDVASSPPSFARADLAAVSRSPDHRDTRGSRSSPALMRDPLSSDPRAVFGAAMQQARDEHTGDEPVPPKAVREILANALARTGPSTEPWTRDAASTYANLAAEIQQTLPALGTLQISPMTCYAAGCMASISYPATADVRALSQDLSTARAVLDWPGPKMMSPGEATADGKQESTWILFRPDESR